MKQPYWQSRDGSIVLYHGDALDVLAGLPDASVDMVFTDPPYGHSNNNGDLIHRREAALGLAVHDAPPRPIANDGAEANELFRAALAEFRRLLVPGGCCCCCGGGGGPHPQFARWSLWLDEVLEFKQMVVWDKGPMGMGWHYRRSYETVLVAQKPGAPCKWYDESNRVENILRPSLGIRKLLPSQDQHPTAKPWQLAAFFIRLHSRPGEVVVDPFAGGGSTLLASHRLGRKAIGIELEENWCELAAHTLETETSQLRLEAVP